MPPRHSGPEGSALLPLIEPDVRFALIRLSDVVHPPALPGCVTEGDTIEEAIAAWIKSAELDGDEIPEEQGPLGLVNVEVAA